MDSTYLEIVEAIDGSAKRFSQETMPAFSLYFRSGAKAKHRGELLPPSLLLAIMFHARWNHPAFDHAVLCSLQQNLKSKITSAAAGRVAEFVKNSDAQVLARHFSLTLFIRPDGAVLAASKHWKGEADVYGAVNSAT